ACSGGQRLCILELAMVPALHRLCHLVSRRFVSWPLLQLSGRLVDLDHTVPDFDGADDGKSDHRNREQEKPEESSESLLFDQRIQEGKEQHQKHQRAQREQHNLVRIEPVKETHRISSLLFDRKESKCSPFPISSSSHLFFVPAKQIDVEFLIVVRKVDVENHVLVFLVDGVDFASKCFSLRVLIFQHEIAPGASGAILLGVLNS